MLLLGPPPMLCLLFPHRVTQGPPSMLCLPLPLRGDIMPSLHALSSITTQGWYRALPPCYVSRYHTGVAYTSECFPCKPGTFSDKPGSFICQVCPRNTYSEKGAKECIRCDEDSQFSGKMSLPFILFDLFC